MLPAGYLLLLACVALIAAACGPAHDGDLLWEFETKKTHRQWAASDEQRLYLCADDVYCLERDTGRLLWKFETFGVHASGPVISDGTLFLQCGGLLALDAATGTVLWEFWTKQWAAVSPAVDGGRVFAPAAGRLFCLDAGTGKQLWAIKTGPLEKAPVAVGSRIFFSKNEKIVCLDASGGRVMWRFSVGSDRVRLASVGDCLLSVGSAGLVRAHSIATGQVRWHFDTRMPLVRFGPVFDAKILVSAGAVYCLSLESGELLWTSNNENFFVRDCRVLGTSVLAQSIGGDIYSLSLADGSVMRRLQLPVGGRLLLGTSGAVFFSGARHRSVSCRSLQGL